MGSGADVLEEDGFVVKGGNGSARARALGGAFVDG